MSEESTLKPPSWFWIISFTLLAWFLFGVFVYTGQVLMTPDMLEALPADERELMMNIPAWATSAFAFGVWGGALGCIFLLLRKKIAMTFFIVSLAGTLVQMYYYLFMTESIEVYGPGGMVMPIMVMLVGIGVIWYTDMATKKGWVS